jgi:hypothetical protein
VTCLTEKGCRADASSPYRSLPAKLDQEPTMTERKPTPIIEAEYELNDRELDCVFGGADRVNHSEFVIVKLVDKASPKLF